MRLVVAVPLKVQVCMCRFSIHCSFEISFFIWYYQDIQEGYGTINACLLHL